MNQFQLPEKSPRRWKMFHSSTQSKAHNDWHD